MLKKSLWGEIGTIHRDGRCQLEDGVIQRRTVLPFRQQALSVQGSELTVAQPHCRQIRTRTAGTRHGIKSDYAVLTAIALGPLHAQLVKAFEIVLVHGGDGRTLFCRLNESPERLQLFACHLSEL